MIFRMKHRGEVKVVRCKSWGDAMDRYGSAFGCYVESLEDTDYYVSKSVVSAGRRVGTIEYVGK